MKHEQDICQVLSALRAAQYEHARRSEPAKCSQQAAAPFITISRQAGIGGRSFAYRLVDRLNLEDPADVPWTVWDNELVERVATQYRIPAERVEALEEHEPSWLEEAMGSLAFGGGGGAEETAVYRRVADTIRALAEIGRVVIVGRGAAFVTRDMPSAVHIRFVAPLQHRIATVARRQHVSEEAAGAAVWEKDHNRELFYRRHWPGRPLIPENFTATFNVAALDDEQLVNCIVQLIPRRAEQARPAGPRTPATTVT